MVTTGGKRERSVVTVLFTDIVRSTQLAADLGDERWREVLDEHDALLRRELRQHRGREIKTLGDGFVAVFKSPADAVACAQAVVGATAALGIEMRAGLHCGEVELRGKDVSGIGVHIAARIAGIADAGEILVSDTLRDLVAGSELSFSARGVHRLRGVPGERKLFAVDGEGRPSRTRPAKRSAKGGARAPGADAPPGSIRVVLADDHPLWRQTLRGVLEHGGATVVGEAGDGNEAVALTRSTRPDVVVMDLDMPGLDGIGATSAIVGEPDPPHVLILSAVKERDHVLAAVRAGAFGYLLKTAGAAEIGSAIGRVHAGELVFPPELAPVVLAELGSVRFERQERRAGSPLDQLTERERGVLSLMAEGRSNQAIAEQLYLGLKTVEGHIAAIFAKLNLGPTPDEHRRVKAVLAYLEHNAGRGVGESAGSSGPRAGQPGKARGGIQG